MSQHPEDMMCEVVVILRSDGQPCDPPPTGVKVLPGSLKYIEWCRKLGQWIIMAFDLEGRFKDRQFILERLPEGYELYEYRRSLTPTSQSTKKRTTSDVYLHGYSINHAQKFRSPAEFFLHLAWLVSGEGECSCKFCSSYSTGRVLDDSAPAPEQNVDRTVIKDEMKKGYDITRVPPVSKGAPALLPSVLSQEQALDGNPNGGYLYRPGELVWFNKNVTTWGLAVISARQLELGKARYLIQPLSHPLEHPKAELKTEVELRPWLAWSVPALGNQNLQNAKYSQIAWDRIINHYPADPVVDGSILAATAIDASYSLFEPDSTALSNPGEKVYKGIFLGAEKIWVGEPVRLRGPGEGIFVLVIKKIIEVPVSFAESNVVLSGDVYTLTRMPAPVENRDIPARMEDDLKYRNRVEKSVENGLWNDWRIVELNAKKGLGDVKGRWYATEHLLPILQGQQDFNQTVASGVAGDCALWMNARGDLKVADVRQKDRRSTFGQAVPDDFTIQGLDDP